MGGTSVVRNVNFTRAQAETWWVLPTLSHRRDYPRAPRPLRLARKEHQNRRFPSVAQGYHEPASQPASPDIGAARTLSGERMMGMLASILFVGQAADGTRADGKTTRAVLPQESAGTTASRETQDEEETTASRETQDEEEERRTFLRTGYPVMKGEGFGDTTIIRYGVSK